VTRGSASECISIAEETGPIVPIGAWVLREACAQLRAWQQEFDGAAELIVNVNLSPRQLLRPELVHDVATTLRETGLAARCLKLEVTEGVLIDNTNQVIGILTDLRALGVQLGLDDFGTGYSALSYLRHFPFQTIKIDRSFISGIGDVANAEIVRAILSMAKGLSMDVTAEGVETAEQLATLEALECELGQGFFFYRPLAGAQAHTVLLASKAARASIAE
jgi:EAL domain-containing protein (putative c-di-GMP-specific phosphodiesterase class I)